MCRTAKVGLTAKMALWWAPLAEAAATQGNCTGLTPRAVLEKLAAIQMLDVSFPTTDGRRLVLPRYTEPDPEQALLLHQLKFVLPQQPPPRITPAASSAVFPQLQM